MERTGFLDAGDGWKMKCKFWCSGKGDGVGESYGKLEAVWEGGGTDLDMKKIRDVVRKTFMERRRISLL